jgi:hypothetical protein
MKWVKVMTTVRREDWVQIQNDDSAEVAEKHLQSLVDQDPMAEFVECRVMHAPTLIPPNRQQCQRLGIGVHPL